MKEKERPAEYDAGFDKESDDYDATDHAGHIMKLALEKITPEQALAIIQKIGPGVAYIDTCCPSGETEQAVFEAITGVEHPVDPSDSY